MHILVTGGAGYVGSVLTPRLLEAGHGVRLFDRFCYGEAPVAALRDHGRCEWVRGDIRRLQETPDLMRGVDAVIHLAGLSNDPSCNVNPDMAHDVNVESTRELANLAVQHGVRRFILASSCMVYGTGVFATVDEESPTNPVSVYGQTTLDAEEALLQAKSAHFEPVILRLATVFGASPRMRFDLAVNQMAATALRQKRITVMGGGEQWRPFVYIGDAAKVFLSALDAPADRVSGEIINAGSPAGNYRIRALAAHVADIVGDVEVEAAKSDDDPRSYRVSFKKMEERLGCTCRTPIETGVEEVRRFLADEHIDPFNDAYINVRRLEQLLRTPVEDGGEPIAARFIPLARPTLGPEEEKAVIEVLRSGWMTTGPRTQAFERSFAEAVGAPHAVAVSSCTAGLHLCLARMGVQPGDEVITSPITWASTGNTIVNMGAKPVFADIDPATLNIDPAAIERAITPRTKVIMPVHLAGLPCDLEGVRAVAERHGVPILEDAAHALGARYRDKPIGSHGAHACFSFYPIKNITTIEGGCIALQDEAEAEALRRLAANGMTAIAWNRYGRSAVAAPAQVVEPGFKYHLNDVSAAMGLEQLKKLPGFLAARRRLAQMYRTVLREIEEIRLPDTPTGMDSAWHLMIVRLRLAQLTKSRDEIAQALRKENVGAGVHFYGLHLHPYYRDALGCREEDCPEATRASHEILSLPLHPGMTDKNVREVVDALKKVLTHARK